MNTGTLSLGKLNRRRLLGFLALPLAARATDLLGVDRELGMQTATHIRRYRVHATITLVSVPIFHKDSVGGACATMEESASGTFIQFSSGTLPERLHGFNRFGMTQEAVRHEEGLPIESEYVSFMTSSPEKSLDQAKKSFTDHTSTQAISIAHGQCRADGYFSSLDHLRIPARSTWLDCSKLMTELRGRLSPMKEAIPNPRAIYTPFMHAVRAAMKSGAPAAETVFVHNAKLYRLRTETSAVSGGFLTIGKIAEQGTRQESEFRVWSNPRDASGLPFRFEFRPKSFLHLVFEQEQEQA